MGHFSFTDGKATLNAVDLSAHCIGIDTEETVDRVEDGPTMGQLSRKFLPTIRGSSITVRFKQDFAAAQVHATLWPLHIAKTVFTYLLRPTSGAIAATNPEFTGTAFIGRYQPLRGSHSDVPEVEVELVPSGATPGLTEDITP